MKALVIFDSNFGNTKIIAEVVAKELGESARVISVSDFKIKDLEGIELLVVGSPINGWRPTKKIENFLANLNTDQLKGIRATSFDTRINFFFHGDAAKKISRKLERAGAQTITPPKGFFVKGAEGPLIEGEIEKAITWAKSIK